MTDYDTFCPMLPFYSQVPRKPRRQQDYRDFKFKFDLKMKIHQENLFFQSHLSWLECHKSTPVQREAAEMGGNSCSKGNTGLKVIVWW